MKKEIEDVNSKYSQKIEVDDLGSAVRDLYKRFIKKREQSLLEAVASAGAINGLFLADEIEYSQITPEMREAFNLKYPNMSIDELSGYSPEQLEGFVSGWKGKYFEVLVQDKLNQGELVGEIQLGPGQTVILGETGQVGWDLQILNSDGSVAHELQLKATEYLGLVKEAIVKYPNIDILTTEEVFGDGIEAPVKIFNSQMSEGDLEDSVRVPMENLLDTPLEELSEAILPGLPFVLITVSEGRTYMMGKKSFNQSIKSVIERGLKSGAAIGVGAIVVFLDGGLISLPASFLTRIGIDRYQISTKIVNSLHQNTQKLQLVKNNYT